MSSLSAQIEAVLFYKNEPLEIEELSSMLSVSSEDISKALQELAQALTGRGSTLVYGDTTVMLATAREASVLIESLVKQELERDLGKAGLETLAIILYYGPVTRSHIDHIRGVNSNFIVRQLLVRGLVERVENPQDQRSFLYKPTIALLSFLGVSKVTDLPRFDEVRIQLQKAEAESIAITSEETIESYGKQPEDISEPLEATE